MILLRVVVVVVSFFVSPRCPADTEGWHGLDCVPEEGGGRRRFYCGAVGVATRVCAREAIQSYKIYS